MEPALKMAPRGLHLHHPRDMSTITGIATADEDVITGTRLGGQFWGPPDKGSSCGGQWFGYWGGGTHTSPTPPTGGWWLSNRGTWERWEWPDTTTQESTEERQSTTILTSCNWEGAPLLRLDWLTQVMYKLYLRWLQKHQRRGIWKTTLANILQNHQRMKGVSRHDLHTLLQYVEEDMGGDVDESTQEGEVQSQPVGQRGCAPSNPAAHSVCSRYWV